jgi:hypothetical protein
MDSQDLPLLQEERECQQLLKSVTTLAMIMEKESI